MASKSRNTKSDDEWVLFADDFNKYVEEVCGSTATAWGIANSFHPWLGQQTIEEQRSSDTYRRHFVNISKKDTLEGINRNSSSKKIETVVEQVEDKKVNYLNTNDPARPEQIVKLLTYGSVESSITQSIVIETGIINSTCYRLFSVRNDSSRQNVRVKCSADLDVEFFILSAPESLDGVVTPRDDSTLSVLIKRLVTVCATNYPFGVLKAIILPNESIQRALMSAYGCDEESPRPEEASSFLPSLQTDTEAVKFIKGTNRLLNSELMNPATTYNRKLNACDGFVLPPLQTATILICFKPVSSTVYIADKESFSLIKRTLAINVEYTTPAGLTSELNQINLSAKVYRSKLSLLQKNMNFGRIVIGESVAKALTLVNNSDVPCLFSILKSGSISSGFLTIPKGRRGWIAPKSSMTLDFLFKPTLPGIFEETLRIENVLDPLDFHSVVVKARVAKPDAFQLYQHPQDDFSLQALRRCAMVDVGSIMAESMNDHAMTDVKTDSGEATNSNSNAALNEGVLLQPFFIGDLILGETSDVVITLRLKNFTNKVRQFIVDATHGDVISLCPPTKTRALSQEDFAITENSYSAWSWQFNQQSKGVFSSNAAVPFEPLPELLQSIVGMHSRFEMISCDISQSGIPNVTVEEKQRLEDKLEHFRQKLTIAIRKDRADKMAKYEKKIKEIIDILGGDTSNKNSSFVEESIDSLDLKKGKESKIKVKKQNKDEDSDAESKPVEKPNPNSAVSTPSAPSIVGSSDATLHIKVGPEQSVLLKIKVTLLPSVNYRPWQGPLPFRGFFRVYECRNEDCVKKIRFSAFVSSPSSKQSHPFSLKDAPPENQSSYHGGKLFAFDDSFIESSRQVCMFLITVSQWSSYATRHMYPDYRFCSTNVLGMSIKMTQASKERVLEASFSVSSMAMHSAVIRLYLIENDLDFGQPISRYADKLKPYDASMHGPISFSTFSRTRTELRAGSSASKGEGRSPNSSFDQGNARDEDVVFSVNKLKCVIEPLAVLECSVRWQPPSNLPKEELIATSVGITMIFEGEDGEEVTHTQIIPVICFLEHTSSFKLDRTLNFGEIPLGSDKKQSIAVTNLSDINELHYLLTPCSWTGTDTVGKIDVPYGHHLTGVIPPAQAKDIVLNFSATAMGRFEQELWVSNLTDHFDQKRTLVTASVTVPQSLFVEFPDLEIDSIDGKFKCLDLGILQMPVSNISDSLRDIPTLDISEEKKYSLKIRNVSDKNLVVTAVSNLKRQCFVFSDANYSELVISKLLPFKQETRLYIVVRPSSLYTGTAGDLTRQGSDNSGATSTFSTGAKSDKTHIKGRELIGGIRLVFYESEIADLDALDFGSDMVGPNYSYDLSMLRKLFETTIVFKLLVGASVISFRSPKPSLHYVKMKDTDKSPSVSHVYMEGEFVIDNTSTVFPLVYQYVSHENISIHGRPLNSSEEMLYHSGECHDSSTQAINLILFDNNVNEIAPGESNTVKYMFCCHTKASGFTVQNVKILNLKTGDERSIKLSIFFSNGLIGHIDSSEQIDTSPSEYSGIHDLPTVSFNSPVWLRLADVVQAARLPYFDIIGPSNKLVCEWTIVNKSGASIMVTPVTNLPFLQVFVDIGKSTQGRMDNGGDSKGKSHQELVKRIERSRKLKDDTAHPSLLVSRQSALRKCGNAVAIQSYNTARIMVFIEIGTEVSERRLRDLVNKVVNSNTQINVRSTLESGSLLRLEGMVGLASSTQILKSFFDPVSPLITSKPSATSVESKRPLSVDRSMLNLFNPPSQESSTPSIDQVLWPSATDSSSYTPLEYYARVSCDVVCPRVTINVKSIDLGSLQATAVREVDLGTLMNMCDDVLTILFENVPRWLLVSEGHTSDQDELNVNEVHPSLVDLGDMGTDNRSVPIVLAARNKRVVKGIIKLELLFDASSSEPPIDTERGTVAVKHAISVRPVYISTEAAGSRGQAKSELDKESRQEFKIRFEVASAKSLK